MNRVSFFSGQQLTTEDFQYMQTALEEQIKNRTTDQYSKGVVSPVSDYVAVDINTATGVPTMKFLPFAAYTNSGERVDVYQDIRKLALDLTNSSNRELGTQGILADSDFGWEVDTPYTICVKYIERAARPRPNVNNQEPYGTRVYSGFKFYAMRTNVDSLEENGVNPYIILATAIYSDGKLSIVNKGVTEYAGIDASRVVVSASNVLTTNYTPYGETSAQQHIRCIGDPSYVSEKNPHGITPKILGIDSNAVPEHERLFHSSGFIGNVASTNSCLYTTINARNRSVDELVVYNFTGTELLNYKGKYLNNLRYGQSRIFIDLEDESGMLPDGTYIVYVNVNDGSIGIASQETLSSSRTFNIKYSAYGEVMFTPEVISNVSLDEDSNCRLFSFRFYNVKQPTNISLGVPGILTSNFTDKQDYRIFGSISANNLQRDYRNVFTMDFPIQTPKVIFDDGTSLDTATSYPDYYISPTLLPRYISSTNIVVSPGRCKDSTNRFLMTLPKQISKTVAKNWEEGDAKGGLAPELKPAVGTWHLFLIAKPDGTCDVAFDTSLTAQNLINVNDFTQSKCKGYGYYRRIASIYVSDVSQFIKEFLAISDSGSGMTWVYLNSTNVAISDNNPAVGGVNVNVPSGITLKVSLNAQSVPSDFTTGSFMSGVNYTTRRNIGKGEFTGFTNTGRLPFVSGTLSSANILVDSYYDKRTA